MVRIKYYKKWRLKYTYQKFWVIQGPTPSGITDKLPLGLLIFFRARNSVTVYSFESPGCLLLLFIFSQVLQVVVSAVCHSGFRHGSAQVS